MARKLFWLSGEEWERIGPYLPRGRRGAHQVDDRRVISGIIHMLKTGARWRDCPAEYGPYTTIYPLQPMEQTRDVGGRLLRPERLERGGQHDGGRFHAHQGAPLGRRGKRGDFEHAIGQSHGGRTTKTHAMTDHAGRPLAFTLTPGQTHDLVGVAALLRRIPTTRQLIADRAYDARKFRDWLAERGCDAVIRQPNPQASPCLRSDRLSKPQPHRAHVLSAQGLPGPTLAPCRRCPREQRRYSFEAHHLCSAGQCYRRCL